MSHDHATRQELIAALNGDLAREYQAIIAYINYSQVLKGAEYMNIARELEVHATEELSHALQIAKQIDYLGGMPTATPKRLVNTRCAKCCARSPSKSKSTPSTWQRRWGSRSPRSRKFRTSTFLARR